MQDVIDNLIKTIYPDGKPGWVNGNLSERDRYLKLEYERLYTECRLQKYTARLILSKLINRGINRVNSILYQK